MNETAHNERGRDGTCTECGHVGSPLRVGPGPGWLALMLWGGAALFWILGVLFQSMVIGYLAAPIFLGALVYTLWYFFKREEACRHCGARRRPASPGG